MMEGNYNKQHTRDAEKEEEAEGREVRKEGWT